VCFEFGFAIECLAAFFASVVVVVAFISGCGFTGDGYVWRRAFGVFGWGRQRGYTVEYVKNQTYHHSV